MGLSEEVSNSTSEEEEIEIIGEEVIEETPSVDIRTPSEGEETGSREISSSCEKEEIEIRILIEEVSEEFRSPCVGI